ncbi:hypothetical protein FA95DRAFT_1558052 [Auriscalpium vulgare]|uniref:Uncharacterized protein n=1 Tax=Auriscalpium vulgare TaxID=40419 RepID=A0ACB8RW48_9AGAM|nr:hypothetical protein FA95DRAFT_1558052 [Auriscalpium vulgare]
MPQDFDVPFHPRTVFTAWRDPSYAQPPHADVEPATKANVSSESHTDSASSPIPATSPVFDAYIDENGQHDAPHEEDLPPLVWDEMAEAPTPDDVPVLQSHDNIKESAGRAMRTAASKQFRTPAIRFRQLVQSEDWNHIVHLIFRPDTWRLFKVLLSLVTLPFVVTFGMFILGLIHEGEPPYMLVVWPSLIDTVQETSPSGARSPPTRARSTCR